jgi:hypothetical protein
MKWDGGELMANRPQVLRLPVLVGILWLTGCALLLAEPPGGADKADAHKAISGPFIRVQRDAKGQPVGLQTAVVRYTSGEGNLVVDLIGAVHVGDRSYYQKLNQQMEQYDVLLYELVAPPGTRIPRGGRSSSNPIALLQQMAKLVLRLESQTEQIDYTKKNFVHADLSPEQIVEAVRNRGEDGLTLFLGIMADLLRQQNLQDLKQQKTPANADDEIDFFSLLLDPDGAAKLKRALAQQLTDSMSSEAGLGRTLSTLLITDRNQAAMKVFQTELAKGKKKIGIFYGAAHLADFDRRLRGDFGLKRTGVQWLTAWDLQSKNTGLEDIFQLFGK